MEKQNYVLIGARNFKMYSAETDELLAEDSDLMRCRLKADNKLEEIRKSKNRKLWEKLFKR